MPDKPPEKAAEKPAEKSPPKTKRERWLELAPKRVENVLTALRRFGNCSNSSYYEWTEEEITHCLRTISFQMEAVIDEFTQKTGKGQPFSFPGK